MDFENPQKQIEEQIYKENSVFQSSLPPTTILSKIATLPLDLARVALGLFGEKLYYFARDIDIHHPDLKNIFDGELTSVTSGSFSQDAIELLAISKFASDNLYLSVLSKFDRIITKNPYYKVISKVIHSPYNNLLNIRFIADESERSMLRREKKEFPVNLSTCETSFNSFESFVRNYNIYENKIKEAKCKTKHFYDLKCPELAKEIEKTIHILSSSLKDMYYGFNKISISQATLIIAKLMSYDFNGSNITVMKQNFPYKFGVKSFPLLQYSPMLYPFGMITLPENISKLIGHLEKFPEIGSKALFDNYWVLVPGVRETSEFTQIMCPSSGELMNFSSTQAARKHLDTQLISTKSVTPVLLGERNESFYFISFCT